MDLPDCPPGAEGYQDTVVEIPRNPNSEDSTSTKAELEFKEHLNSLRIKLEDGTTRCMVERRGRDVSAKWIYLCFPCAAVCSGESILQTHISGKKHKAKLAAKIVWPLSIYEEHPYIKNEKSSTGASDASEATLQKMADEVSKHKLETSTLDNKYSKFRYTRCQIQDSLDKLSAPLLGVEYLVEHPPEEAHHEPSYTCLLCNKKGAPRTIVNHMVCYWHRIHYLWRHFPTAHGLLQPFRNVNQYREGVGIVMNRLVARIEETYGRLKPLCVDKDYFNREVDQITQWVFKGYHFSEKSGTTFAEIIDKDLITSLCHDQIALPPDETKEKKRDPSPPVVAAPTRSFRDKGPREREADRGPRRGDKPWDRNDRSGPRRERRPSTGSLSDLSLDERDSYRPRERERNYRERPGPYTASRPERERHGVSERITMHKDGRYDKMPKVLNLAHKLKVAAEKTNTAELAASKTLAYHEKNPEKHPLYPEEWKKFWNRRYKELQAENKDPTKHDFKPEWIVFWTKRMKDLHDEDLRKEIAEIHRKLNLPEPEDRRRRSPARRSPARRSPARQSVPRRSRSPLPRNRSPLPRNRSPQSRNRSPLSRNRSPLPRNRSPLPRNRSPATRREPVPNPYRWRRDDQRQRSLSPLSLREAKMRESPALAQSRSSRSTSKTHSKTREMVIDDAVLISDEELGHGSDSLDSLGSLPDAKSPTHSRAGSQKHPGPGVGGRAKDKLADDDAPDDVVSSLRLLTALEEYLGSLGPKVVDLMALALKMEKERPNSSEQLLENEITVSLIETAKEKLKGAVQAGMVTGGAAAAARRAITRAAALLHLADKRAQAKKQKVATEGSSKGVAVAGVGAVDKAAIARQMAAALIAQGKTDVTTEELAQLVDAVVGMAEAKKREAEKVAVVQVAATERAAPTIITATAPAPARAAAPAPPPPPSREPSASALQMLQSAYDEQEKKEKEEAPDVMDGLSDSDLKTLLQNFAELSAEEQHGLIAYLKKLEARTPRRVERLREYVSAAVSAAPPPAAPSPPPVAAAPPPAPRPAPAPAPAPAPPAADTLHIDSDDDDYTVEEIFKSAAEKVKANQIRQEMEVVQKLLSQEQKAKTKEPEPAAPVVTSKPEAAPVAQSAAANLLALVQASVHASTAAATARPPQPVATKPVELPLTSVSASVQPKLFGDVAESQPAPGPYNSVPNPILSPAIQRNYSNQGPMDGSRNLTQQIMGSQNLNQQGYSNQEPMDKSPPMNTNQQEYSNQGPMGGPQNTNQQEYSNQGPMGGPQNTNQQEYSNQGPMGGPQNTNQQEYSNQGPMGGPQNTNQQEYSNQGPMGGPQNNQQEYSNQGSMGAPQIINQQEYGNKGPIGGPQNTYQKEYGNQRPLGRPQNMNQQEYSNQHLLGGPQKTNQQEYSNQRPIGGPQNINQQEYNNRGPIEDSQNNNTQEYSNRRPMGGPPIINQQELSNQGPIVGTRNMNQQGYGMGGTLNTNVQNFNAMGGNQHDSGYKNQVNQQNFGYNNQLGGTQLNQDDYGPQGSIQGSHNPNPHNYGQPTPTEAYPNDEPRYPNDQWGGQNNEWSAAPEPYHGAPNIPQNGGYGNANAYGDVDEMTDNYSQGYGQDQYRPNTGNFNNYEPQNYGNNNFNNFRGNKPAPRGGRGRGGRARGRAPRY